MPSSKVHSGPLGPDGSCCVADALGVTLSTSADAKAEEYQRRLTYLKRKLALWANKKDILLLNVQTFVDEDSEPLSTPVKDAWAEAEQGHERQHYLRERSLLWLKFPSPTPIKDSRILPGKVGNPVSLPCRPTLLAWMPLVYWLRRWLGRLAMLETMKHMCGDQQSAL